MITYKLAITLNEIMIDREKERWKNKKERKKYGKKEEEKERQKKGKIDG